MELANETLSIKRYPSSGLSALVIGGGIAGLSFAIEAYRKGHDVRIVDRRPNFDDYGKRLKTGEGGGRRLLKR